jgi:DNA-binding winged helix-turn-helix (wHTH) protein
VKFSFSNHLLHTGLRELRRDGELITLQPQVFDLLVYLLENRDRVVSRDDLIALVWGGRLVSDSTLDSRINAARNAIGDSGKEQKLIRTIPRKGIRLVAAVEEQSDTLSDSPALRARDGAPPPSGAAGAARHRRAAVQQHERRSGTGIFLDGISEDIITALSRLRWFSLSPAIRRSPTRARRCTSRPSPPTWRALRRRG